MYTSDKVLLLAVTGVTETVLVHFQLSNLMVRKKMTDIGYRVMLCLYFLAEVFDAVGDFNVYFAVLIAYALIAVIAYFNYEGSNAAKLSISFVCIAMNYSAAMFSAALGLVELGIYDRFPRNLTINISAQLLLTLMVIALVYAFKFYVRHISTKFVPMLITVILLPMAIFVPILKQLYPASVQVSQVLMMETYIVIGLLVLVSSLLIYALTDASELLANATSCSAALEQMLAMQNRYYGELRKHQKELRSINHDISNHTRAILGLIEAKQYDEVKDYALTLQQSITDISAPVTSCDNHLINALLNDKLGSAKQNGVELILCVMVPSELKIDNVDMCILLGNILDNAVEACARMDTDEKKFIDVDIRIRGFFLCFDVSNSYSGQVAVSNSKYLTSKKDSLYHGVGISNIQRVVDKYNGRLNISHDKDVFNVSALLTYSGNNE